MPLCVPVVYGKPTNSHVVWEWLGRLKWRATGLDASVCFFFFYNSLVFAKAVCQSSFCFAYVDLLT